MRTKYGIAMLALLLMVVLLPLAVSSQDNSQTGSAKPKDQSAGSSSSDQGAEGRNFGDWNIQQSFEVGYRFNRTSGNSSFYDDLVNLHQGPRFLSQDLSVRSMTHTGSVFDNLYVSSFGWGGDPENVVRWNVSKVKAYNFTGNWRRDYNNFDYNLLANPLNPSPTGTPFYVDPSVAKVCTRNGVATFPTGAQLGSTTPCPAGTRELVISPHDMALHRRMMDMALTLFPQAAVSLRLGYTRNNMSGPSFSSFHEGTDVLLFQPWDTTQDGYRIGIDFKVLPRTIISYDQYLDYFKNDTDWDLAPLAVFNTAAGVPVSFGLPFNIAGNSPCATPFLAGGTANPACSGYQSYTRFHRYRTKQPTEQLTIQSNYLKRMDFVLSGRYATANMNDAINENFLGVVVRTGVNERAFSFTGPAAARRITNDIDAGATIHLSDTWRVPITYHFLSWRNSGSWDSLETVFSPTTPALIGGDVGTPVATPDLFQIFFGNKQHELVGQIEHDFKKTVGARLGIRYTKRDINHRDFAEDEADITKINEETGLVGLWFRPGPLRFNADAEFSTADNFLTRISPRHQQRYRARLSYNPKPWAVASAYGNFWEARNGDAAILFKGRNRNAGVTLDVTPNPRFGIDLGYNFNLWSQNSTVCFFSSFLPPGTLTGTAVDPLCAAGSGRTPASTARQIYSVYNNHVHYGSIAFYVKPVKRVTANLGYSITSSDGTTTIFNTLQPLGPLTSTWHQPLANFAVEAYRNVTLNFGFNYWGYFESDPGSAVVPRNFHANNTTLSLKYAF